MPTSLTNKFRLLPVLGMAANSFDCPAYIQLVIESVSRLTYLTLASRLLRFSISLVVPGLKAEAAISRSR
jgi:hypothetical protein